MNLCFKSPSILSEIWIVYLWIPSFDNMAVTAIWDVKGRLDAVVRYITNPDKTKNDQCQQAATFHALDNIMQYTADEIKTEKQYYVSGVNCDANPRIAREQFCKTKRVWGKEGGIICFHGYQSFKPGEVSPEMAHALGIELAKRLWGDRFEILVATHLNTGAVHNHFVLNSVSFVDGLRYYDQKATYAMMREKSDALCREFGLSIVENPRRGSSRHIGEIKDAERGKYTIRGQICEDIDQAINETFSWKAFCNVLQSMGYVLEWRGSFYRIRPDQGKRFFRFDRLGEGYTVEDIRRRLNDRFYSLHNVEEAQSIPKRYNKAKGLHALFLHYQFLLGALPKQHPDLDRELYAELKNDRKRIQKYSDAAKLLGEYQIETAEQLHKHSVGISEEYQSLAIKRKKLRNRLGRMHDRASMQPIKAQITELTEQMGKLRKEMRTCEDIAARCDVVELIVNKIDFPEYKISTEKSEKGVNR